MEFVAVIVCSEDAVYDGVVGKQSDIGVLGAFLHVIYVDQEEDSSKD